MANYTPDSPYVLGEEWVPIKTDPYTIGITEEKGTSFNLSAASTIVTGRFYVSDPAVDPTPDVSAVAPIYLSSIMAIYPKGKEDQTGPMRTVTVPCNGGSLSGDLVFSVASSVAQALARTGDFRRIESNTSTPTAAGTLAMNFAFSDYPELTGKRIVQLEFLHTIRPEAGFNPDAFQLYQSFDPALSSITIVDTPTLMSTIGVNYSSVPSVVMPRFNIHWGTFAESGGNDFSELYPWTYPMLQKFDANTVTNRQTFELTYAMPLTDGITPSISFSIDYAAIRVTYCEEQRLAYGGTSYTLLANSNTLTLRPPSMASGGVLLPAGNYTVTVDGQGVQTDLFALKELYAMQDQPGITINRTTSVGSAFTSEQTDQILQLSLHTASAAVTGVHGYGTQVNAQVYAGVPARQEIVSRANGTKNYPWARFYARRFGDTSQPLTLRHSTFTTITASISVTGFDALPEIVDGWKEVTLQFSSPTPSFNGAAGLETYEWVSNELAGSRWEVLGTSAYVKLGTFPLTQITGAQALDETTYGGSSANLTWNGFNDTTSDGVLMFAQEMPAVSGLSVSTASLAVTGVGLDCGVPPECVPTGISYNNITWTALGASSMPASGFGYYELQRYDAIDAEWNTILNANSPLVTGFHDYEARIGIQSKYRIRFQHRLLFPSAWSSEVTSTIAAPGVAGSQVSNSAVVFTTNEVQSGNSSLAYTLIWNSTPDEEFTFIEAGTVQLQKMYLRDFQVAFRPLERGGERFQRTILVQGAAVPSGLIRDGFKSLRDLAWEEVSYVCVRNELGDRWYATVLVPSGNVLRNRRLYMAQVDIIEVTDTPSIVNLPTGSGAGGTGTGVCFASALWDQNPGWDYGCWS